ncbi:Uncharacterized protein TCAP_06619 [Tolypocladium capitatum]|uniref:Glycoside hydrolase n=1 Tax=Tolypocladium capitatum TaxID=45235 RepID=A0A2K3Q7C5_9HYPO|nr:Uncharacterized protein TCAP_06619 [Tolypocladium capitatum]
MSGKLAIVITALAATVSALPTKELNARNGDQYNFYTGNGSDGAGWPDGANWTLWGDVWNANVPLLQQSCGWNGWGANNSGDEINAINDAIQQISGPAGLDPRFVLAVMMQESKGCVRVPTTNNGVTNPGLMQSHNGAGSCAGQNPCPRSQIFQMIQDGVTGTSSGAGLQQLLAQARNVVQDFGGGPSSRAYYAAARLYNSGSADYNNLDNGLGSTACYASDVANRLTGWTLAASQCRA